MDKNNYRQFNADKKAAKKGKTKPNPYKGDVIYGPLGQLANPWKVTKIPGDTMSTSGYGDIPLWTVPDVGEPRMVMPNSGTQYFPGASSFTEYPVQASEGGWLNTYPGGGQIYDRLGRLHSTKSYVPKAQAGINFNFYPGAPKDSVQYRDDYNRYVNRPNTTESDYMDIKRSIDNGTIDLLIPSMKYQMLNKLNAYENARNYLNTLPPPAPVKKKETGGEWLDTYQSGGSRKANKVGMFLTNDEVGEYADKGYIPHDISDIDMRRIRMANPKAVVSSLTEHQYFKKGTPEYQYSRYYTPPVPIDPEMYKKLAGVKFDLKKEDKSEWDLIQERQARKKAEDEYNSLPVTARGEKPLEYVPLEAAFLPAARGFGWLGNMAIDAITGTMRSPIKSLPGSPNTVKQVIKEEMKKVVEQEIDKIPPSFYFNPKPTSVVDMESDYVLKNWDKLTKKIPGTTGAHNLGIYNFPEHPDYIAKIELVKDMDRYIPGYMDMNLENMFKDLNNPNLAKVYRSISQEISPERMEAMKDFLQEEFTSQLSDKLKRKINPFERTLIMNKIPGKSLIRHTYEALENIDYDAIRKLYEDLKYARSKELYGDFKGAENILYDPKTNRFGVVDLSIHPGNIDSDWARHVLKDVAYPDIPTSSANLKTAIMDFIKERGNQYLRPGTEDLLVRPNPKLTRKINSFYDQFRREPLYKEGGQWLDQYQDGKEYKWDFGEIKPTTYYIKGVNDPKPPKTTTPKVVPHPQVSPYQYSWATGNPSSGPVAQLKPDLSDSKPQVQVEQSGTPKTLHKQSSTNLVNSPDYLTKWYTSQPSSYTWSTNEPGKITVNPSNISTPREKREFDLTDLAINFLELTGLGESVLPMISEDKYEQYKNYTERRKAKENPNLVERKSVIDPAKIQYDPIYTTGDTLRDTDRRYHIPEIIDLDYVKFGTRNRGEFNEIQSEGAPITLFKPFQDAQSYFKKNNDPANATYVGVDSEGRLKAGQKELFTDGDWRVSRVFSNKVVDFNRDAKGDIVKVPSNPKASKTTVSPSVKVLNDKGSLIDGKLSILLPKGAKGDESFDLVTGGRYIFQTPDGKTKLVSGSLKDMEGEFYRMKKDNPYVEIITLDNGAYSRGLRTYDKKFTSTDLKSYDLQNEEGANFAYILPGERKTRYLAKFDDFEKTALADLKKEFPGHKVDIRYQNTAPYNQQGFRDISSQEDIHKQGYSQTPVSLHNLDAARDYLIVIDGKVVDPDQNKPLYSKILWNAADKTGVYHVGDATDNWDPAHIGLVKEGQKTGINELYYRYPDIFGSENFKRTQEFVDKNKNNPMYREMDSLFKNITPFYPVPPKTIATKKPATKQPPRTYGTIGKYTMHNPQVKEWIDKQPPEIRLALAQDTLRKDGGESWLNEYNP